MSVDCWTEAPNAGTFEAVLRLIRSGLARTRAEPMAATVALPASARFGARTVN